MTTTSNEKIEYQVREVKRWIVTRFESADHAHDDGRISYSGGSEGLGEFDNEMCAYNVAYALCKEEHGRRGWPVGDGRIKYPEHPDAIRDPKGEEIPAGDERIRYPDHPVQPAAV